MENCHTCGVEHAEYELMDAAEARMWWYRALHARLLATLTPVRGRVIDAGCGTGGLLAVLRRRRPDLDLVGVEWSPDAAARAARKSGAAVVSGSINALPVADARFDAAIAADVLCHAAVDPLRALHELLRVLRPGGVLAVNMPAYAWLHSAHDRRVHNARRITAAQLAGWLAQAGFRQIRARYWNGLLLPMMIAHRKLRAAGEQSASDVALFPSWLDASLYAVTVLERRLPMPAGGSVLATARRP
jgi:SAM-dependent methyltransferase